MANKKKYPVSFYIVSLLFPFLILGLLELGLRAFGYAGDDPVFIPVPGSEEKLLVLNPDLTKRYFKGAAFVPHSINDVFLKTKDPNTPRIMILGESSAAGFPFEPNGGFSRFLDQRLSILYPKKKFEIVNLGIAAINSYAIMDILEDVIDQKPDLVLIYTGHNEYYGALGAASMTSIASSPGMSRFLQTMGKLRFIRLLSSLFSGEPEPQTSPGLMESLAKDKLIPLDSDLYQAGVDQFEHNLNYILEELKKNNIPVVIGTLVSNLMNQPPFIAENSGAGKLFENAEKLYKDGKYDEAKVEFIKAKDMDELRFRAPESFNSIIKELASKHGASFIRIDSAFNSLSRNGIVGNDLMTDHLHPNLAGYNMMSALFLDGIVKSGILKEKAEVDLDPKVLDSLTFVNLPFSKLDSLISDYRLLGIKSQWPFNRSDIKIPLEKMRPPVNFVDSMALQSARGELKWDEAHTKAANWFVSQNDITGASKEFEVLIAQFPYFSKFYNLYADALMQLKLYDKAKEVLIQSFEITPGAYSTKWLGILALSENKAEEGKKWLLVSLNYDSLDPQALYNLAGAFINLKDFNSAKIYLGKCLEVDPKFPGARELNNQLKNIK
jgi:tetratricopeptide (TPR) repeat protein